MKMTFEQIDIIRWRDSQRGILFDSVVFEDESRRYNEILGEHWDLNLESLLVKLEKGSHITFDESYLWLIHVLWWTNNFIYEQLFSDSNYTREELKEFGLCFLFWMRFREERGDMGPDEIAWMVAGTRMDFTNVIDSSKKIFENCWMGWDKWFWDNDLDEKYSPLKSLIDDRFDSFIVEWGISAYHKYLSEEIIPLDKEVKQSYKKKSKKTVNVSTLCSLITASLWEALWNSVMKHWSWKNTTAVWSTDAVVKMWIPIQFDTKWWHSDFFDKNWYVYTDAVKFKTIHDISTLIQTETVNHLLWPMTPPITRSTELYKVLWINHSISNQIVAKAYELLWEKEIYNVKNVIVVWWFDHLPTNLNEDDYSKLYESIVLDEFSPKWTILSIIQNEKYIWDYIISEKDFWIEIDLENIMLPSVEEIIIKENKNVIEWNCNEDLLKLICCNAALWIILINWAMDEGDFIENWKINSEYLIDAYNTAKEAIQSKWVSSYFNKLVS